MPDTKETDQTRTRYERIAPFYDRMELLPERRYRSWRSRLWSSIEGPKVLEVGVGTGNNMPYYPENVDLTAIDLTPGMLERASHKAISRNIEVDLQFGDVQALAFPDNTFDEAVATFVFCSVPDPRLLGLSELKRVVKRGGRLFFVGTYASRQCSCRRHHGFL